MKYRKMSLSALKTLALCLAALAPITAFAETGAGRTIKYSPQDIVTVYAKVRFSTLIILPDTEEILDFTTGDKDFWIVNGVHNLCYVHPAQKGIHSNLNLVTASGHVYSFLLTEISNEPNAEPDLKLIVEAQDQLNASHRPPLKGYVRAEEAESYKKDAASLRAQLADQSRAIQNQADEQVNKFRATYAREVRFDYELDPKAEKVPFLVSSIYHDRTFTYINCAAAETPTLYEMKDGKPNLINFQIENGIYIVPKILDSGYLAVGKKKVTFTRKHPADIKEQ